MLDDKFERGRPLASLSARWLNEVARILHHLRAELTDEPFPSIEKPAHTSSSAPWIIRIPRYGGAKAPDDPESGGSGSGGGTTTPVTFTLPSTVRWEGMRLMEREMAFDGTKFTPTGTERVLVDFTPVTLGSVVTNVSNTGEAITKATKIIRIYAPNGGQPAEETGDMQTTRIIALTPRDANESTPYGEGAASEV